MRGKRYHLNTCAVHAPLAIRQEMGMVGHPGKRRIPTASDIMRERFEADADRYMKPLEEALLALKAVVVGNGAHAHVQTIEDYSVRLRALEVMLDRIYGKPKQAVEHSGPDGEAMEVVVPDSKDRQLEVARVLAEVEALGSSPPVIVTPNASASAPSNN